MATRITLDNIQTAALAALGGPTPKVQSLTYSTGTAAAVAGGQTVTLTGANFATGMAVLISPGSMRANNSHAVGAVTLNSATNATFVTPAKSAGYYVLYVINSDGRWGSYPMVYA